MKVLKKNLKIIGGMCFAGFLFYLFIYPLNVKGKERKEVEIYMTAESTSDRLTNKGFEIIKKE